MFRFFAWVREQTRAAALAGLGDAARELGAEGPADGTADALALLGRLQAPALPAPAAGKGGGRRQAAD